MTLQGVARTPEQEDVLADLATRWPGEVQRRCASLARARFLWDDDPALGPLLSRWIAFDILEASHREDAMGAELIRAAEIEESSGWLLAASHTRHQLALLTTSGGRLEPMIRYYRESLPTLGRHGNDRAIGLCLRSLGELALRSGRVEVARGCWERAERALAAQEVPEAQGPAAWLAFLESLEAAGRSAGRRVSQ